MQVIANLFMEDFENMAFATVDFHPKLWKRYMDDTFVIWPHGTDKLQIFLHRINDLYENIEFTTEKEENNQIAFLDVLVIRTNNFLTTSVYRKPTHYLNFRLTTILGLNMALSNALHRELETSVLYIYKKKWIHFIANGYPSRRVDEVMKHTETMWCRTGWLRRSKVTSITLCPRTKWKYHQGLFQTLTSGRHSNPTSHFRNLLVHANTHHQIID